MWKGVLAASRSRAKPELTGPGRRGEEPDERDEGAHDEGAHDEGAEEHVEEQLLVGPPGAVGGAAKAGRGGGDDHPV